MRKLLNVLLIAMLGLFMFTACNPESKTSEELVSVKLMDGQTRALKATLNFDISTNVKKWKYSAVKADKGLTTGQTGKENKKVLGANNETELLSQGYWDFYLYGYDDDSGENLICTGEAKSVLVTLEKNTVTIMVAPEQEATGTIVVKSDISILFNDGSTFTDSTNVYTKVVAVSNATTGEIIQSETKLSSGLKMTNQSSKVTYKVVVSFIGDYGKSSRYTAATATKYINVYDNLTTTVSGSITESGTETIINAKAGSDYSAEATIASSLFAEDTTDNNKKKNREAITIVAASGISTSSDEDTVEVTENALTFPAGSIIKNSDSSADATLTMQSKNLLNQTSSSDTTTASEEDLAKYTISGKKGAPVATLEFKLTGASLDEKLSNENSANAPTGYVYIAAGQGDSFDVVNGSDDEKSTVKKTPTLNIGYLADRDTVSEQKDSQTPELLKYDSTTGYLEYRVYHFSTYVILSNKYVASDSNGNLYETLEDAAEKVTDGATITLWKNVGTKNIRPTIRLKGSNKTLNMGTNVIYGSIEIGSIYQNDPKVNITIKGNASKDYNVDDVLIEYEDGGYTNLGAIVVWKPSVVVDGGVYRHDNAVLYTQVQGVYDQSGNLVYSYIPDNLTTLTVREGKYVAVDYGSCLAQIMGKTVVEGGDFTAEENGDIFYISNGSDKNISKVIVNNGTFKSEGRLITLDSNTSSDTNIRGEIEIYGGNFSYTKDLVGWSESAPDGLNIKTFVRIYGGTFSSDPSDYVVDGYHVVRNDEANPTSWTVVENNGI